MKHTLLEKCNADVFKAILDIKAEKPDAGQELINLLQKHEYWWQMTGDEILRFAAHLPYEIWNYKIHTFYLLFESQPTTKMP
jgi:NADH:ubiquinone oxidoreductase subunit E